MAVTLKVAVPPMPTVALTGWAVMAGGITTVNTAPLLVTLSPELLTTQV